VIELLWLVLADAFDCAGFVFVNDDDNDDGGLHGVLRQNI